jgi:hypothetical protein
MLQNETLYKRGRCLIFVYYSSHLDAGTFLGDDFNIAQVRCNEFPQ